MKSRRMMPSISPGQHRISVLTLFFIYLTGCSSDNGITTLQTVQAKVGQSASLSCEAKDVTVTLIQWTRCNDSSVIGVFSPGREVHIPHKDYKGRTNISENALILQEVKEGDFGKYCCKLTTFPNGIFSAEVNLKQGQGQGNVDPPHELKGLPKMMVVYISCGAVGFVVLSLIIIIGIVCHKRRRRIMNPVHVTVRTGKLSTSQSAVDQKGEKKKGKDKETHDDYDDDDDDDDGMYLNISKSDLVGP